MGPIRTFMAACLATAALTSPVEAQMPSDSADPVARVPAATYRSPFAGYRPLGDDAVGNWRAANDEVGRIGGWREYAREAQGAGASRGEPDKAQPKPAAGEMHHGSHGTQPTPGRKP